MKTTNVRVTDSVWNSIQYLLEVGIFNSAAEVCKTAIRNVLCEELNNKSDFEISQAVLLWKREKTERNINQFNVVIGERWYEYLRSIGSIAAVCGYCLEQYLDKFLTSPFLLKLDQPILILDTETTGLNGYPQDRVLEIGISEINKVTGTIRPIYNELIHYPDMREFAADYESKYGKIWEYTNTDMTIEDTLNAKKDLATVICEVRSIVKDRKITSYNVKFDFDKFLFQMPWNLQEISNVEFDIMDMATDTIREMMEHDSIPDKALQGRLIDEDRAKPGKWIRSLDAYKVLCPDDPAKREGVQSHRALDDTIQEAHILKALWKIGRATE